MPAWRSGERYLHTWVQGVWRFWQRGLIKKVESIRLVSSPVVINMGGRSMSYRGARGEYVGIATPMRDTENAGKGGGAFETVVDGLGRAERPNRDGALVDQGLEGASNVLDEGLRA